MGLSFSHRILQAINIILSSHWLQNNFQAPPNSPPITEGDILGDPGADKGGEGKSKRTEKYGTKESKEPRTFTSRNEGMNEGIQGNGKK